MVLKESVEEIVKFFKNSNVPLTKRQVAKHMLEDVPLELKLSYVTTSNVIDDLVEGGRVIKLKEKEPWRRGQSQHFIANFKDESDQISDILLKVKNDFTKLEDPRRIGWRSSELKAIESYDKIWIPYIRNFRVYLDILQNRTLNNIHSDKDAKILYDSITELRTDLNNKDFKVGRYVNQLKEYLKDKATSKRKN